MISGKMRRGTLFIVVIARLHSGFFDLKWVQQRHDWFPFILIGGCCTGSSWHAAAIGPQLFLDGCPLIFLMVSLRGAMVERRFRNFRFVKKSMTLSREV